nr:MAG TPA: hypothetical protein [Caudoviricetes sp.]
MDFATFEKIAAGTSSEEGVIARFYDRAVKTGVLSADGLPQFKMQCFCEIRIKDNNSEVYDQPATEDKIRRFPKEYACYQLAKKETEKGTPLRQFAFLDAAEIESLKLHGIFTVEALAGLSDDKVRDLGLAEEKALAVKFVEQARGNLTLAQWQKKENEYLQKIKMLESKIEDMRQQSKMRRGYEKYTGNMSGRG